MADPTPVTLAYANPRALQPAGSRFAVEPFDDGVELSRPLPPELTTGVTLAVLGLGTLVTAAVAGVVQARQRHAGPDRIANVTVVLLLAGTGVWLVVEARRAVRPRVQVIAVRNGLLTATHVLRTASGRPWSRRPRSFGVQTGGTDLLTGRRSANLLVANRFGLSRTLLSRSPADECLWIAALLNAALALGRPPRQIRDTTGDPGPSDHP